MNHLLRIGRIAVHGMLLVPLFRRWFRMRVAGTGRLPSTGPAIVIANHNSHLDTAALLAALDRRAVPSTRPVAAADYFLGGRIRTWFFTRFVQIVPIDRSHATADPLAGACEALAGQTILIVFPEGTRGIPGEVGPFRRGIAELADRHPLVPIIPVHIRGCAEALPKGARRIRRTHVTLTVGAPVQRRHGESAAAYTGRLRAAVVRLGAPDTSVGEAHSRGNVRAWAA